MLSARNFFLGFPMLNTSPTMEMKNHAFHSTGSAFPCEERQKRRARRNAPPAHHQKRHTKRNLLSGQRTPRGLVEPLEMLVFFLSETHEEIATGREIAFDPLEIRKEYHRAHVAITPAEFVFDKL